MGKRVRGRGGKMQQPMSGADNCSIGFLVLNDRNERKLGFEHLIVEHNHDSFQSSVFYRSQNVFLLAFYDGSLNFQFIVKEQEQSTIGVWTIRVQKWKELIDKLYTVFQGFSKEKLTPSLRSTRSKIKASLPSSSLLLLGNNQLTLKNKVKFQIDFKQTLETNLKGIK